jgi:nitrogen fixation/metabolism regulation signal transduction histidine kinase
MAGLVHDLLNIPGAILRRGGGGPARTRRARRLRYQKRVMILALATGRPGTLVAIGLLVFSDDYPLRLQLTLLLVVVGGWFALAGMLYTRVIRPLQTAANMLSAMREGDFSMQAGFIDEEDALGQMMYEINSLSSIMRRERLGAIDAINLLNKVMEEIDLAIFAFAEEPRTLRLVNRAGEHLLGRPMASLIGRRADDLGLAPLLDGDTRRPHEMIFPGRQGRFGMRRGVFREGGLPYVLVLLTDISQTLRDEEREAWKRLIRVIGHELNNSLAPIHSLSSTLDALISRDPLPDDWRADMKDGLEVIRSRATHLSRFMEDYASVARLPPPKKEPLAVAELVWRIAALETRAPVRIVPGPECKIAADVTQLEQALINLLKNAGEAAMETRGGVRVGWELRDRRVAIWIEDDGPGIANPANLFTPFYSTKRGGSGIGLTVSRQIVEAHDGSLTLENRAGASGARATVLLPM